MRRNERKRNEDAYAQALAERDRAIAERNSSCDA
jgi:hypothetical protein